MIIGTALVAGVAGWLLAPRLAGFAERPSRWLDRRLVGGLAAVIGVAVPLVATGWAELITYTVIAVGCAALVLVDLAALRLPDRLVGPLYLVTIAGLTVQAAIDHQWLRLAFSLAVGFGLLTVYFILGLVSAKLGLGDVKLAGLLGVILGWFGWSQTLLGMLAAFAVFALVAAVLLLTRRVARGAELPFGPFMIIGAVLGIAAGPAAFPALG